MKMTNRLLIFAVSLLISSQILSFQAPVAGRVTTESGESVLLLGEPTVARTKKSVAKNFSRTELQGKQIQLRFTLKNAKLYSFRVADEKTTKLPVPRATTQ